MTVEKVPVFWYNSSVERDGCLTMKLKENQITLGQLLQVLGYVSSGGEAKHRIHEFDITVNGEKETRRGRKIVKGDIVTINSQEVIFDDED